MEPSASGVHGKGRRWQARYVGPDGRERTSLHRTQAEAEREIVKQESRKLDGSWIDPKAGKVRVGDFALNTWLPAQAVGPRTEIEYRGIMERYVIPEWGDREIASIRPSEAAAWQKLLLTKYEPAGTYPAKVSSKARGLFRLAVLDRVIAVSPFQGVPAPTCDPVAVDPPDLAEVLALVEHAYHDRWRVMIDLASMTGMRSGELRGLTVDKIDFLRREIRVHQQLVYEPRRGLYFAPLKTSAGRRTIPVPQEAVDLLAAYIERYPPASAGEWSGLLFRMDTGEPVGESTWDWALKSICRKAGVRARHGHELRHHYASVLIAGGENPRVVQERLGHKDVSTTMRIYAHLWAEADSRTRSVLEDARRAAREGLAAESPQPTGRIPEPRGRKGPLTVVNA
ncbi:tyrosine-type recombinase/integrase [Streptomyces sp. URMC 125]|uniref:tyrosine-type recombinase/integrase n=1 Tax=Streptomyces sp. URMC 125 TaxID=3423419 RepID=UPI003F199FE4